MIIGGAQMTRMTTLALIVLFSMFILLSCIDVRGSVPNGTIVAEDIKTNTTWDKAHSPYIVSRSITVYGNATLTIEHGVVVIFANGVTITLKGNIIANGEGNAKVVFKLVNPKSKTNYIVINAYGGSLILKYTDVEIPFIVLNGIPRGMGLGIISGNLIFENTQLNGIALRWTTDVFDHSRIEFRTTIVKGCIGTLGLVGLYPSIRVYDSNITIDRSLLVNGISIEGHKINMSIMDSFLRGLGLELYDGSQAIVKNSSIAFGFLKLETSSKDRIVIRNSMIYDNTRVELNPYKSVGESPEAVDVRYNWWGDPSGPLIDQLNPGGKGQKVDIINLDVTRIIPWLTRPPKTIPRYEVKVEPPIAIAEYPTSISIILPKNLHVMLGYFEPVPGKKYITNNTSIVYTYNYVLDPRGYNIVNATVFVVTNDLVPVGEIVPIIIRPRPKTSFNIFVTPSHYYDDKIYAISSKVVIGASIIIEGWSVSSYTERAIKWIINNTSVSIYLNDKRFNATNVRLFGNGVSYIVNMTLPDGGPYRIKVNARNILGNYSSSLEFYVDTKPPTVEEFMLTKIDVYKHIAIFKLRANDPSGVMLLVYINASATSYSRSGDYIKVYFPSLGTFNVTFILQDHLGHKTVLHKIISFKPITNTTVSRCTTTTTVTTTTTSISRETTTSAVMSTARIQYPSSDVYIAILIIVAIMTGVIAVLALRRK